MPDLHLRRDRYFRPFCSCDLDLDPMNFIYELDPYSLEIHKAFESYCLTDRQTDEQTRQKLHTTALRG